MCAAAIAAMASLHCCCCRCWLLIAAPSPAPQAVSTLPPAISSQCMYIVSSPAALRSALSCLSCPVPPSACILAHAPVSPLLHRQLLEPPALQIRSGPSTQLQRQPAHPEQLVSDARRALIPSKALGAPSPEKAATLHQTALRGVRCSPVHLCLLAAACLLSSAAENPAALPTRTTSFSTPTSVLLPSPLSRSLRVCSLKKW